MIVTQGSIYALPTFVSSEQMLNKCLLNGDEDLKKWQLTTP